MIANEEKLSLLESLLRLKFMTASQIADVTGCSKPTAYARVNELRKRGLFVVIKRVRVGSSGPAAMAFGIGNRARTGAMKREDKQRLTRVLGKSSVVSKEDKKRLIAFFD